MSNEEKEAIIEKIRKVLARTESNSEAEAETAMKMAHSLLQKYNLTMEDLSNNESYIIETIVEEGNKAHSWKLLLLKAIARYNYCDIILYTHNSFNPSSVRLSSHYKVSLVGSKINSSASKIMMDYLFSTIDRLSKREAYGNGKTYVESYKIGLSESLSARLYILRQQESDSPECTDLVVREDTVVSDHIKTIANSTKKKLKRGVKDDQAFLRGLIDGEHISLNDQINENNEEKQKLEG